MTNLVVRLKNLIAQMDRAALVAVSKNAPTSSMRTLYKAGQLHFAENRVQELKRKADALHDLPQIIWHFVGTLQSNKVNSLFKIPRLHYLHSVDSLKLLKIIYLKKNLLSTPLSYFLQMNVTHEEQKKGFESYEEVSSAVKFIKEQRCDLLRWEGLMGMGKYRTDDKKASARECFIELRKLKIKLEQDFSIKNLKLSMGMSEDYKIALEEGSDYVRIGTALFSER